jgi:hypothetical protein
MTLLKLYRPMFAAAAIAVSCGAVASAQYKFVKIDIPGSLGTAAFGISNKNEIVGYYWTGSPDSPVYHGFLRTNGHPAVLVYPIDDPSAEGYTDLTSINSNGDVVGTYQATSVAMEGLLLEAGQFTTISVPGCTQTLLNGINDKGELVGSCPTSGGGVLAWFGGPGGYSNFLPPGAVSSFALANNTAGDIAGSYFDGTTSHGLVIHPDYHYTVLDYPGATGTYATGISDKDVVAGSYYINDSYYGFLYHAGKYTTVSIPGASNIQLGQINKNGWFVGSYTTRQGASVTFYAKPSPGPSVLVDSEE